jgi:superfamily II DNA or RNA helicase
MAKSRPFEYVNLHGLPVGTRPKDVARQQADRQARQDAAQVPPADADTVFDALALSGWRRGKTPLTALLGALGWQRVDGKAFNVAMTGAALHRLQQDGRVQLGEGDGWAAVPAAAQTRLPALLARPESAHWWRDVAWAAGGGHGARDRDPWRLELRTHDEQRAMLCLLLLSGADLARFNELLSRAMGIGTTAMAQAAEQIAEAGLVERVHPVTWSRLLSTVEGSGRLGQAPALLDWIERQLTADPTRVPASLKLRCAERRLQCGDDQGFRRALQGDPACAPFAPVLEAAWLAREGRFADAAAQFPPALKALGAALSRRRGLVPHRLSQWYLLSLLAQPDPKAWTLARKFAIAESGSRQPSEHDLFGRWAHAAAVRLGDTRLEPSCLQGPGGRLPDWHDPDLVADALVLAAWLGHRPGGWTAPVLQSLADALVAADLPWKAALLQQACERLELPVPQRPAAGVWPVRFYAAEQARWRDALAAIVALGDGRTATADAPITTLQWRLRLDDAGRPSDLQALEPTATGRGRPKPVSLLALKKRTRLDPRDAAVARCIRSSVYRASDLRLDLVAAVQALVGHPDVVLSDAPEQPLELQESLPAISVRRQQDAAGEHFRFLLDDPLVDDEPPALDHHGPENWSERDAEIERRNSLRVFLDAPGRARLVRISPAQRRVAELVAQQWQVPADARRELDAALRVLSGHFVVHSDAEAGEPVAAEPRLLAQLQPRGDALQLQLGVRPFGDHGPLLAPGHGRARLMTLHHGVSLSTERDLAAERAHLDALLAGLPALGEAPPDATWLLDDPETTLATVEHLGRLAVQAQERADGPLRAVEWPRGRSLRVLAPGDGALRVKVGSGRDWFALSGELALDDTRVLSLQRLLALLRDAGGSRFVALGQGEYLALTEQLRQRLSDLDALAEADGDALRLGTTAAGWLADAAVELGLTGDKRWREQAARLEAAATLEVAVPAGLRAELRPYQHGGLQWMARLAQAGFGACLADDMGLGKTVQTLALLLLRAGDGPALVAAPTSVCANWVQEAERFAPGLNVHLYGDGDRQAQVDALGAGGLMVVSYALLQRDIDRLQAVEWATLVLDEAQALKNAAAQRTQAAAALRAGFRLALTGTPVENRLADLWSLMQLLNPGLLGNASRFAERFANPIERERDAGARARLRRLVSPFLLRRTKAQVLTDLPPRTEILYRVEPTAEERAFLEAARREALARVAALPADDGRRAFNVLAELMRLRRAACDPRLAAPELGLVGAKLQAFERLARELVEGRHQALVFSQFTDFLKLLAERLDAAGLRYRVLDGSTPARQRAERVAEFQRGDADLFLISLKAGGFGLNLTAADYVIIADPWWNPAAEDQAMGRAHRMGQQRPVTVYRLVTAGSVEERIVALHTDKRELADSVLSGQDGGTPLRADDLVALLRD